MPAAATVAALEARVRTARHTRCMPHDTHARHSRALLCPCFSPCSSRRVAHSSMPASAAVKGVVRPERASPPAAAPASPVCTAGGTAPLCGRVPRVPQMPWHRCAAAAVRRSSRALARSGGTQNDETSASPLSPLGLVSANYHLLLATCSLLLATYCRRPTPHRQGPRQHQLPRGGGGCRLGRLPRARYGRAVRRAGERASSRRWQVGGDRW